MLPASRKLSPVDEQELERLFRPVWILITVVIVALFLQKGEERSTLETAGWLSIGTIGVLLVASSVMAAWTRRRLHTHPLRYAFRNPGLVVCSGLCGLSLFVWSSLEIDDTDVLGGYTAGPNEVTEDSGTIALRNLLFGDSANATRIVASVINKGQQVSIIDQARLTIAIEGPEDCAGNFPVYKLNDAVAVRDGVIEGGRLEVEDGPLDGFTVPVKGRLTLFCDDIDLSIEFPITTDLRPGEDSFLVVDIPKDVEVILEDVIAYSGQRDDYPIGEKDRAATRLQMLFADGYDTIVALGVRAGKGEWACISEQSDTSAENGCPQQA